MQKMSDTESKQASSGWHIALEKSGDRHYLGSQDVVNAIVRHFIAGVCDRFSEVSSGRLVPWDAAKADREACEKVAHIMSGKDREYESMGEWNEVGLGRHIAKQLEAIVKPEDLATPEAAIQQCCAIAVHHVYDSLSRVSDANGMSTAQENIEWVVQEMTNALLGAPSELFDF